MNLADLLLVIVIALLGGIGITALTLLLDVLFPRVVRRARGNIERMPVRSFVVGLVNLLFLGVVVLAALGVGQDLENNGARVLANLFRLVALFLVLVFTVFCAFAFASAARWVGERLAPEAPAPRQIISGIVLLQLAALAPVVGWVLVPLFTILVGYGAVVLALISRRDP